MYSKRSCLDNVVYSTPFSPPLSLPPPLPLSPLLFSPLFWGGPPLDETLAMVAGRVRRELQGSADAAITFGIDRF